VKRGRKYSEAIADLKQAISLSEGSPALMGQLGLAYGLSGARVEAGQVLNDLNALSGREYVPSSTLSLVQSGLAHKAVALDLLDRAYDEHDFALVFLRVAPWFRELRGAPQFERLATRMRLPLPAKEVSATVR
jgi:hypothetical protein